MSDSIRPVVAPGVTVRATDQPDLFEVAIEGRSSASLPRPVLGILLCFDGERTYGEIDELVRGWGAALPRADFVRHLARQLSAAGLVRLGGRALQTTEVHRHSCEMCGNSCRGPEIGPLPPGRAEQVEAHFATLVEEGVQPPDVPPIRRDDSGHAYLARHDGQCVFLASDNLCRIHARFGLEAKPVACRLFPVVAVRVDGDVRVGISGSCMRHHENFDGEETLDVERVFERAEHLGVRPMPRAYRTPRRGPRHRRGSRITVTDDVLLDWLDGRAVTLEDVARVCATGSCERVEEAALGPAVAADLARIVGRWAERVRGWSSSDLPRAIPAGSHREGHLRALAETLAAATLDSSALTDLPERWRRYLAYRLRNHVFLRAGHGQGDLRDSLLLFLVGAAAAAWAAAHDSDGRSAETRFGEALVVWSLATDGHQSAARILGTSDRGAMVRRWVA